MQIVNKFLEQMPAHTIKGNNTGSTANPIDLTATQVTAELNQFTSSLQGVVPGSGGGTTNFLRADGSWAAPAGSGANTALSNLATTSINQSLLSSSSLTLDLGSSSNFWNKAYIGYIQIDPTVVPAITNVTAVTMLVDTNVVPSNRHFVIGSADTTTDALTNFVDLVTGSNKANPSVVGTGDLTLYTGDILFADPTAGSNTGNIRLATGTVDGDSANSITSGTVTIETGGITTGTSQSGPILIQTGALPGGSSSASGDIILQTGPASSPAVRGTITLSADHVNISDCYYKSKVYTVANLPSAATAGQGARAFVSNANATTFNSTVAGGGSNKVPVFSDGTNWKIG